jgi:hypothetical protein
MWVTYILSFVDFCVFAFANGLIREGILIFSSRFSIFKCYYLYFFLHQELKYKLEAIKHTLSFKVNYENRFSTSISIQLRKTENEVKMKDIFVNLPILFYTRLLILFITSYFKWMSQACHHNKP